MTTDASVVQPGPLGVLISMVLLLLLLLLPPQPQEDASSSGHHIKYVSHVYSGGADCLLTGSPRTAEVGQGLVPHTATAQAAC